MANLRIIPLIKSKMLKVVMVIQKTVITILLFLVYVIGFGLTKGFVSIFGKSLNTKRSKKTKSFWIIPKDCEPDINESKMES
jgi:hypothetical protein